LRILLGSFDLSRECCALVLRFQVRYFDVPREIDRFKRKWKGLRLIENVEEANSI